MTVDELDSVAKKIRHRTLADAGGCRIWQGAKNTGGYGVMRCNGRLIGVHRIMLAHKLGRPDLLDPQTSRGINPNYALHSCDNPACCNPKHLRLGSQIENGEDKTARNRHKFNPNLPRKLTDDAVREIRRDAQTWEGLCDMMKKYRIGQNNIQAVADRRSYKHVPD